MDIPGILLILNLPLHFNILESSYIRNLMQLTVVLEEFGCFFWFVLSCCLVMCLIIYRNFFKRMCNVKQLLRSKEFEMENVKKLPSAGASSTPTDTTDELHEERYLFLS